MDIGQTVWAVYSPFSVSFMECGNILEAEIVEIEKTSTVTEDGTEEKTKYVLSVGLCTHVMDADKVYRRRSSALQHANELVDKEIERVTKTIGKLRECRGANASA